jgi:hypothetical protein
MNLKSRKISQKPRLDTKKKEKRKKTKKEEVARLKK